MKYSIITVLLKTCKKKKKNLIKSVNQWSGWDVELLLARDPSSSSCCICALSRSCSLWRSTDRSVIWCSATLEGSPSDLSAGRGLGVDVKKLGPMLKGPWLPNNSWRNSLCRRCSSFNCLLSRAWSSECNTRLHGGGGKGLLSFMFEGLGGLC